MAGDRIIRLEGTKEFRRALKKTGDDMADLKATHKEGAEIVARRSAQIVPTGVSGLLRDSIDSKGTTTKGYVKAGSAALVPYAGPVHFGWPSHNITPQPFIYDAMDDRRAEVLEVYGDRLAAAARLHGLDVKRSVT